MVTLLVGLTFSEIVLLYWFFLPMVVRLFYEGYIAKNRRWVADNPAFQERFPSPRYSIWFSYLVGSAWIALLVRVYFFERAWLSSRSSFPKLSSSTRPSSSAFCRSFTPASSTFGSTGAFR